jgi:arsenate reductase
LQSKPYNVLFLCTGNSARSILGEALLNAMGRGRFLAFSAGSHPTGRVNPLALELLAKNGIAIDGLHSKSWEVFAAPGAPELDFIITVCDSAAAEACPVFPGRPIGAHWGIPDPAAVTGDDLSKRNAFQSAYAILKRRISLLTSLPPDALERDSVLGQLVEIGKAT